MKIEEIRELVALLEKSELNVLEVCEGESRIRLEKAAAPAPAVMPAPVYSQVIPQAVAQAAAGMESMAMAQSVSAEPNAARMGKAVKSPMVGVYYGSPAPGEEPFVTVGSRVEKGDVICIVEAMKLMNEITAEMSGEVVEICVEDGEVVEYGQPLFYIK